MSWWKSVASSGAEYLLADLRTCIRLSQHKPLVPFLLVPVSVLLSGADTAILDHEAEGRTVGLLAEWEGAWGLEDSMKSTLHL